ncbi:hypothetical protein [Candidatus Palauibacter sp.]|uniref:hypothetical protein n=1 Tax=Candidatus Palauibacter sp. TaxID=3101350 RepID=UPI003D0D7D6C
MQAGDCFLIGGHELTPHLWIILTRPSGDPARVLIASCTSRKPWSDDTVLLDRGDHPFIRHETVIAYTEIRIVEARVIEFQLGLGKITRRERMRRAVLDRVVEAVLNSTNAAAKFKQFILDQDDRSDATPKPAEKARGSRGG